MADAVQDEATGEEVGAETLPAGCPGVTRCPPQKRQLGAELEARPAIVPMGCRLPTVEAVSVVVEDQRASRRAARHVANEPLARHVGRQ